LAKAEYKKLKGLHEELGGIDQCFDAILSRLTDLVKRLHRLEESYDQAEKRFLAELKVEDADALIAEGKKGAKEEARDAQS